MAITCAILGASGGLRFWRDQQFRSLVEESAACPFPLKDLPESLGRWRAAEGSDTKLDPKVARIAGSSDHLLRSYVEEKTGDRVSVMVLYGRAEDAYSHTPEVCYPAAGYQTLMRPVDHEISLPGSTTPVHFRSGTYTRRGAGIVEYEEVYYTFLHNGEWMPDTGSRWKMFRYHPGIFKLQLQRSVTELSDHSPTESLLKELIREINGRIAQNKTREANGSAKAPVSPPPDATVQPDGRPG